MTVADVIKENKLNIFFALISIVYIILATLFFFKNPYKIVTKYNAISIVVSLFGGFIITMLYFFIKRKQTLYSPNDISAPSTLSYVGKLFVSILMIGFVGSIIFGIIYAFKHATFLSNVILYLLNIAILIGIITLAYTFIKQFITNPKNPFLKLLIDVVTYIPCIVLSFINYMTLQYNITTKPVWILFGAEIIFITLLYLLPKLFDKIIKHDTSQLLSKPTSLTRENIIGNFEILNKKENKSKFTYNYAISSWVYLEAQPPSTNSSYIGNNTILSYGGKPNIYYNGTTNEIVISAKIGYEDKIIFRTKDIPFQKWFNIIINYQGGTMDIFINNKLIKSVKNIVPYMTYDNIVIGKKNGIYGFIKDVSYFNKAITKDEISWIYKTMKF
jgi:hypothetical protein